MEEITLYFTISNQHKEKTKIVKVNISIDSCNLSRIEEVAKAYNIRFDGYDEIRVGE